MAILTLKKINFTDIKVLFFKGCTNWEMVSNKISFAQKSYTYFIGYLYNDDKVKSLHIMLLKTSAYVKLYDGQTKWM